MKKEQMTPVPLARAVGLGSAKHGFSHWRLQRLSAVMLVPLGLWFVWSLSTLPEHDLQSVRTWLAHGLNTFWLTAFVLVAVLHAKLGVDVVIEDYIHTGWLKVGLKILLAIVMALVMGLVVYSVVYLSRGA